MKPVKLAVIGVGSASFGPGILADVLANPAFKGSTLSMVDTDKESLDVMKVVADRMNREWASGVTIEATTDRKRALPDADYVIVAFEVERMERWELDFEVALKHGLRQPESENGGPGGFAHGARNIAIIMGICDDMRRLCPDAWFFTYTNPVPRITLAASKYGGVKAAGFCHGIGIAYWNVGKLLDIPREDMDLKAAGLNHFTWVLDARRRSTGEDLYPTLRGTVEKWPADFEPLTKDLLELLNFYPVCGDGHVAEYLQWVTDPITKPWEKYGLDPPHIDKRYRNYDEQARQEVAGLASGETPLARYREGSGERACHVAEAISGNLNSYEEAVNIPNEGYITNLPQGAIVEVPATVSAIGVRGLPMGDLPEPIGEMCRREIAVAELAVKAAVTGDRKIALHALLMDAMMTDIGRAKAILDGYLEVHGDLLPQFGK